ncbi:major facilitator superfamily domain-containing protein [Lentinula guzmanii]|uniref:Major facilitator superfamily domain-containing protein n=1 Tax=Lentinula guzmanii TaxID=2804957 RepID=A0AA38JGI1_9AGAR|nr:major facilitator superfamily domain-containing protein [Lentinula guzmanii]
MTVSPSDSSSTLNETTPLLNDARDDPEDQKPLIKEATPLPMVQLFIVCAIRLMDPIAFTQIFPYINEFIAFLKLTDDPSQTGFYSGLVESAFAVTQFLAIYQWSKLSNKIGRRPVIMVGTFGVALSTMYFGLSSSLTDLLLSRAIGGIFGGTVSVVQSVVGEITDASNQAAAFPIYGLVWPIGGITGPFIGGVLSNPADKYGSIFQNSVFSRHPYFLPCLVAGIIALLGVLLGYFCLQETLRKKSDDGAEHSFIDDREPTLQELLSIPIIRALSISAFALNFNGTAFDVLFVLFCFTPIQNGGLAFSPSTIGFTLSSSGLISSAMQIFIMPVILKRIEASKIYNMSIAAWPVVFATIPILNIIARRGLLEETGCLDIWSNVMLWTGILFVLAASKVGGMAYSVSLILTKTNVDTPAVLAVSNGVMSCAMSLARIISPALASSAFALSEEHHLLGGYFWALMMVCFCLLACSLGRNISRLSRSSLSHHKPQKCKSNKRT